MNLCVVVGLIPVTGVTLPFLSYGGSSLLVSMASIGIILNISKNNNWWQKSKFIRSAFFVSFLKNW